MSNAPVLSMAAHKAALDIFVEAGMSALREKSLNLTGYLEFIVDAVRNNTGVNLQILTPSNPNERGCQLSIVVPGATKQLVKDLADRGIIVDWREPNVIRMAPVSLYNSFKDIFTFGEVFTEFLKR
jgi:kynureninase